jgi:signal transduction histidine kinase
LLWRTIYPFTVLLTVLGITIAYQLAGFGPGPIFISLVIAFLTAASRGRRWHTYPLARGEHPPPAVASGAIAAWLLVLVAMAEGIRQRRSVIKARAQRQPAIDREARAEQERHATQARLSIARELHDVLAHGLSNDQRAVLRRTRTA